MIFYKKYKHITQIFFLEAHCFYIKSVKENLKSIKAKVQVT